MTNFEQSPRYKTFLLTVWEERNSERRQPIIWRFSLVDPHTSRRQAYSSLEALMEALHRMTGAAAKVEDYTRLTLPTSGILDIDHDPKSNKEEG